jgi:hypothetical protein
MKYFLILIFFVSTIASCANIPRLVLSFQNRADRFCEDAEAKEMGFKSSVGLVCFRYCEEYRLWRQHTDKNCKSWNTDVLDLKQEKDFLKFRNAGFILINQLGIE